MTDKKRRQKPKPGPSLPPEDPILLSSGSSRQSSPNPWKRLMSVGYTIGTIAVLFSAYFYLFSQGLNSGLSGTAGLGATSTPASATEIPTSAPTPNNSSILNTTGHIIFVSNIDGQTNLSMTNPEGSEQTQLATINSEIYTPRVSPDGTKVAFASMESGNMDIYVLDIATYVIWQITSAPQKDANPSWSADGSKITFDSFRDGNFEIYITNPDGSDQIRLTYDPANDVSPIFSPVSNDIAFISDRFGNSNILLLNLENGITSSLTTSNVPDFDHSWSPDGSMLAYKMADGSEGISNICIIGYQGLDQHCLNTPAEYGPPVWSPDGKYLAATVSQTNGSGIDVLNITTDEVTHLSNPEINPGGAPSWSPEGSYLVFQSQTPDGSTYLFTVLIPTNEFRRLTNSVSYEGEPVWMTK